MVLEEPTYNQTTTNATEQIVSQLLSNDLAYWGAMVFIPSTFTTGDKIEIRWYAFSSFSASFEPLYYKEVVGQASYNEKAIYVPPTQTKRYQLTLKRTLGVDRAWRWQITRQSG